MFLSMFLSISLSVKDRYDSYEDTPPAGRIIMVLVGLYIKLLSPILYGVWHTNGRSWGASYIAQ